MKEDKFVEVEGIKILVLEGALLLVCIVLFF
jgi:hypothetical protein